METFRNIDQENVFFTSDTHFFHKNIIEMCNRPFKDVEEMNEKLIENWNNKVSKDAIVFHLGDFAFAGTGRTCEIISRLNGTINLVMGNHDFKNINPTIAKMFNAVQQQLYVQIGGYSIYLNHFPMLCFGGAYNKEHNVWQLFGHVHSGKYSTTGLDMSRLNMLFPTQYDVGVDNNDFAPVSFKDVKFKIEEQIKEKKS